MQRSVAMAMAGVTTCVLVMACYILNRHSERISWTIRQHVMVAQHEQLPPIKGVYLPLDALQLEGRMLFTESNNTVQLEWPASSIRGRFQSQSIAMEAEVLRGESDSFAVSLNGNFHSMVTINRTDSGPSLVTLATDLQLDQEHEIHVMKITEPQAATTSLSGFDIGVNGRWMKRPPQRERRIEVIGDSISCGFGVECASGDEEDPNFSHGNAFKSYASVAARALSAEVRIFAWSGKGFAQNFDGSRNDTMPKIMNRILPSSQPDLIVKDEKDWQAHAVIVNLFANDMMAEHQDSTEDLTEVVSALVKELRQRPGKPLVVLVLGPMIFAKKRPHKLGDFYRMKYVLKTQAASYPSGVIFAELPDQTKRPDLPLGCSAHPGVQMHKIMGQIIEDTLRQRLDW